MENIIKKTWEITLVDGDGCLVDDITVVALNVDDALTRGRECLAIIVLDHKDNPEPDNNQSIDEYSKWWDAVTVTDVCEGKTINYWE